jgi:hypothetical protein
MEEPIKLPYGEKLKRIVQFVISKGVASHSDIIRFAVDQNYGEGTFDSGKVTIEEWRGYYQKKLVTRNRWRGYYSAGFSSRYYTPWLFNTDSQHFLEQITDPKDPNFKKYIGISIGDEEFKIQNSIKKILPFI